MTNQQHSITPPPEVVDRLFMIEGSEEDRIIASYRAGADQELKACCEWLRTLESNVAVNTDRRLRLARRPKPPSLKEQALALLDKAEALLDKAEDPSWDINDFSIIRQALEALSND
jgi:hypothetical protein